MISFKSFIQAIHTAVNTANEQLMQNNTQVINQFFEESQSVQSVQKQIQGAANALDHLSQKKDGLTDQEVDAATDVLKNLSKNLSAGKTTDSSVLTPKTVSLEYPVENSEGEIEITEIQVPLITLTPITMSQIEKTVFKLDFELELVNDEVQLNFVSGRNSTEPRNGTRGNLEIELTPQKPSEGLQALIEGYERILKSQIQH